MNEIIKKIQERTLKMPFGEWTWGEGVAFWGLNHSNKFENMCNYNEFLKEWVDKNADKINYTINGSIPCISAGEVFKFTNDSRYKEIVKNQAEFLLNDAPRIHDYQKALAVGVNYRVLRRDEYSGVFLSLTDSFYEAL